MPPLIIEGEEYDVRRFGGSRCVLEKIGNPHSTWTVRLADDEKNDSCTCPGFRFHGHCKHVTTLRESQMSNNTQTAAPARTEVLPAEAPVDRLPARVVQPAPQESPAARALPHLCAALAAAQKRCQPAHKDSTNTFHRYRYASAEAIFAEAKQALADSGLAILPMGPRLATLGTGNQVWHALDREVHLLHDSGESARLKIEGWPVVPDKGRPLDKAFAAAVTTSLAYLLRDLLQMPRVDPDDDQAGHADSPEPAAPARAATPPAPAQPRPEPIPGCVTMQQLQEAGILQALKGKGDRAREILALFGVERFGQIPEGTCLEILKILVHRGVKLDWFAQEVVKGRKIYACAWPEQEDILQSLQKRFHG